ncbi:MAG: Na+/H+ antiporter NhaA [Chloroflexi bacterium]|nr:Na+/H+ antiporter NhaA [Chloroflexota bacterium]
MVRRCPRGLRSPRAFLPIAASRWRGGPAVHAVNQRILLPLQAFIRTEAFGGILLLAAAVAALAWVNSPWDASYADLWDTHLTVDLGFYRLEESLAHFVNDGLMAIFFFVVGMEIKREIVHGELREPRRAALPIVAALGGMAVPALIYTAFNAGGPAAHGWGIPMATDIAFAVGVLALLGRRIPLGLKVFLLALAIVDDLGAIVVIAVFYTDSLSVAALGWAALTLAGILVMNRAGIRNFAVYAPFAVVFWAAVLESGIHATLAGVALAVLVPSRPVGDRSLFEGRLGWFARRFRAARARGAEEEVEVVIEGVEELAREAETPLDRLERLLHPWVSYGVVPVFALANAGVAISAGSVTDALGSSAGAGAALGLLIGKPVGIFASSWLAVRMGLAALPVGVGWRHIGGAGLVAGMGFTVSLFITALAFEDPTVIDDAKIAILVATIAAGSAGYALLRRVAPLPANGDVAGGGR